ncbi:hypothetical protein HY771_01250 [Candidatus Uhrbacteria bacterium]|nr:hypothetical protein [Candidatus Uhrbacteria bacterium]
MPLFLNPSYWLTIQPASVGGTSGKIIFGLFILIFVFGIAARVASSNTDKERHLREFGDRVATMFVTMGILGALLYFFSFEQIRLFGARFWYLLWLVGLVVWCFFLWRFIGRTVPERRAHEESQAQQRKYFPQRRKK